MRSSIGKHTHKLSVPLLVDWYKKMIILGTMYNNTGKVLLTRKAHLSLELQSFHSLSAMQAFVTCMTDFSYSDSSFPQCKNRYSYTLYYQDKLTWSFWNSKSQDLRHTKTLLLGRKNILMDQRLSPRRKLRANLKDRCLLGICNPGLLSQICLAISIFLILFSHAYFQPFITQKSFSFFII